MNPSCLGPPPELIIEVKVGKETHKLLVDSGATYTTLKLNETELVPTGPSIPTVDFEGKVISHQFSEDVEIISDSKKTSHKILSPTTP